MFYLEMEVVISGVIFLQVINCQTTVVPPITKIFKAVVE